MYSVLRFIGSDMSAAKRIGEQLNLLVPGAFDGIRRANDGFAASVVEDDDWQDHQRKVREFIETVRSVVGAGISLGFRVVVDTAVEPEDYGGRLLTTFPFDSALLKICVDLGVEIEFSLYGAVER